MLCLLAAHDVGLNLWSQLHPGEIPVAVGIVEPMHSSLLPLCRTHQRARSGAQIRRVRLPCQDYGWHTIKGEFIQSEKVIVILRPERFLDGLLPCWPTNVECFHNTSLYVCSHPTLWRPEYGSYMIEGTPGQPYGGTMSEFNTVEGNMGKRRREASSVLNQNETLCTITSFPRYFGLHWANI